MTAQTALTLTLNFTGEGATIPRLGRLYAPNATLSQITAAGYLNNYLKTQNVALLATDFIFAVASNGHQVYKPVNTNGSWQLVALP